MKKMIFSFIAVLAIAVVLVSWKSSKVTDNSATITKDFGCGLLDGNGGFVFTDASHSVVTSNGNGTLKCSAAGVPNSTGSAVQYNDFGCNTPAGFTTDMHETVSASGQATLTCKVHWFS